MRKFRVRCARRMVTNGGKFLGYQFHGFGGPIRVSGKNVLKFQRRAKEITRRNRGLAMSSRLKEPGQHVRGWTAYFCLEQRKTLFKELEKWLRRRIRACYWKWWKNPRTRGVIGGSDSPLSITHEMNDIAHAFGSVSQSYSVNGLNKEGHASINGFGFNDNADECDCHVIELVDVCGKNDPSKGDDE